MVVSSIRFGGLEQTIYMDNAVYFDNICLKEQSFDPYYAANN